MMLQLNAGAMSTMAVLSVQHYLVHSSTACALCLPFFMTGCEDLGSSSVCALVQCSALPVSFSDPAARACAERMQCKHAVSACRRFLHLGATAEPRRRERPPV